MKTKDIVLISLFSSLIAVSSFITVPLFVPVTLGNFAVLLTSSVLGGRRGTLSVFVYLMLGVLGLPVFSGFRGGISVFLDVTGGYLIGYLLSAFFMWATEKAMTKSRVLRISRMTAAVLIQYAVGTIWYTFVYVGGEDTIGAVLAVTVLPFVIPDAVKILLAEYISSRLKRSFVKL